MVTAAGCWRAFSKSNKSQLNCCSTSGARQCCPPLVGAAFSAHDMHVTLILPIALAISLSACSDQVEDTRPGQPVKMRQTAFKEMLRVFEPMGTMLRDGKYNAGKFEALATDLISKRNGPWGHFAPDTNYPPTKARPEVWTNKAQFDQAQGAFFGSTDALLTASRAKDLKRVTDAYSTVYDHCQSCHREFKKK